MADSLILLIFSKHLLGIGQDPLVLAAKAQGEEHEQNNMRNNKQAMPGRKIQRTVSASNRDVIYPKEAEKILLRK